jgi:hypothetical protein
VARENLRRIKSEITNKLKDIQKKLPLKSNEFSETIDKLRNDSMNDLKSKVKQDEKFQKEYIEELSSIMDDKIMVFYLLNKNQLDDGLEDPQQDIILNEQFIQTSQMMKLDIKNLQNIFISYSHDNKEIVHKIADKLKENFSVWIDRDKLKGGDDLKKEIAGGIRNSSLFICFISEQYCESGPCRREFGLADNLKIKILPVMLHREAKNGVELDIAVLNTFYAFKPPNVFEPWSEDLYQKLLKNIFDLTQ